MDGISLRIDLVDLRRLLRNLAAQNEVAIETDARPVERISVQAPHFANPLSQIVHALKEIRLIEQAVKIRILFGLLEIAFDEGHDRLRDGQVAGTQQAEDSLAA